MATVKKKLPYELYDVAGLEDWFSQMAAEGYHLVDCWQTKAEFTVATPKENVRYRLEAQGTYQHDWNKDRAYAESGWHHVTTIAGFFYIFQCDDPAVEELHTDPTIQSWTMKKLIRRQWFTLLYVPLMWFFMRWQDTVRLVGAPMEVAKELLLKNELILIYAIMLVSVGYFMVTQGVMLAMLSRLKKRLASGQSMDRTRRHPRSFWMHGFGGVLFALCMAVLVGCYVVLRQDGPAVDPADYPHVSLEEVIPGQYFYPEEKLGFWEGSELETSLLVPVQFKYGDAAILDGDWTRVRTFLYYYETISESTAELLLKGSIQELCSGLETDRERYEENPMLFDQIVLDTGAVPAQHDKLDELWVYDYQFRNSELHRVYFGRTGNRTLVLYTMLPEPEKALDIMVEKMKNQ